MSKNKVLGILMEEGVMPSGIRPEDFNRPGYLGISLWNGLRNDQFAILLQSSKEPYRYQVTHGYSSLFFNSLTEAENYCKRHGFEKKKRLADNKI